MKRRELTYTKPRPRQVRKPKGPTARARAKRRRAEKPVADDVRARCVLRDGYCRARATSTKPYGDVLTVEVFMHVCEGSSQWAHLRGSTRAETRGMKPEQRHTTRGTLMLCQWLHDRYDGRAHPRLNIEALTDRGADGPLRFTMGER